MLGKHFNIKGINVLRSREMKILSLTNIATNYIIQFSLLKEYDSS